MSNTKKQCTKPMSGAIHNASISKKYTDYHRATLKHHALGKGIEVMLLPPETFEDAGSMDEYPLFHDPSAAEILAQEPRYELKKDLKQALGQFSPIEQRILFRVLVQGQSVTEATKNMKHRRGRWEPWLRNVALPKLRELLADYYQNGKLVLQ